MDEAIAVYSLSRLSPVAAKSERGDEIVIPSPKLPQRLKSIQSVLARTQNFCQSFPDDWILIFKTIANGSFGKYLLTF